MTIEEYFGTLQQSFIEVWKDHLSTAKYSDHKALNDYYDDIVDAVDTLIENWQGKYGKTGELKNTMSTEVNKPVEYLESLRDFTIKGRDELISKEDTELWSDIDTILSIIDSTIYKLKELSESNIVSLKSFLYEHLEKE